MKEESPKSFVRIQRGSRKLKLFTEDLKKIFKIQRKALPPHPPFCRVLKPLPSTDVDDDIEESQKVWFFTHKNMIFWNFSLFRMLCKGRYIVFWSNCWSFMPFDRYVDFSQVFLGLHMVFKMFLCLSFVTNSNIIVSKIKKKIINGFIDCSKLLPWGQ